MFNETDCVDFGLATALLPSFSEPSVSKDFDLSVLCTLIFPHGDSLVFLSSCGAFLSVWIVADVSTTEDGGPKCKLSKMSLLRGMDLTRVLSTSFHENMDENYLQHLRPGLNRTMLNLAKRVCFPTLCEFVFDCTFSSEPSRSFPFRNRAG